MAIVSTDPSGTQYAFRIEIASPASETHPSEVIRYDDSRMLGTVTYADVFEVTRVASGLNAVAPTPDADWVRIVMARDAGLVEYQLRDGPVFTRSR